MPFVGILLGVIVLSAVIYLAVSKQSSFKVRLAALAALGIMILTVIICLFVIFGGAGADTEVLVPPDTPALEKPPAAGNNSFALIVFILFLIVLFVMVLCISFREQRKSEKKEKEKSHAEF